MEYILLHSTNPKSIFAYLDNRTFMWSEPPLTKIIQKHSTPVKALLLKLIVSHPCYLPFCCTGYNELAEKCPTQRPLLEVRRIREKVPKRCMVFFDGIICFLKRPEIGRKICFFVIPTFNLLPRPFITRLLPDYRQAPSRLWVWYTKLTSIST